MVGRWFAGWDGSRSAVRTRMDSDGVDGVGRYMVIYNFVFDFPGRHHDSYQPAGTSIPYSIDSRTGVAAEWPKKSFCLCVCVERKGNWALGRQWSLDALLGVAVILTFICPNGQRP
jgi:hypothetical protein